MNIDISDITIKQFICGGYIHVKLYTGGFLR